MNYLSCCSRFTYLPLHRRKEPENELRQENHSHLHPSQLPNNVSVYSMRLTAIQSIHLITHINTYHTYNSKIQHVIYEPTTYLRKITTHLASIPFPSNSHCASPTIALCAMDLVNAKALLLRPCRAVSAASAAWWAKSAAVLASGVTKPRRFARFWRCSW